LQKAKRLQSACARNWSRKFGSRATNIDALWPHFWVQNLALVLGPQNTNRSYWIGTASMLLPAQADSRSYPWYCVYIYICVCVYVRLYAYPATVSCIGKAA
jgi:hypothetical protein